MVKKILSVGFILIRPFVPVAEVGIITPSEPSFGVFFNKTVGKVRPPSVESKISTLCAFTNALSVFATSHLIFVYSLLISVSVAVFGYCITKGPAVCVDLNFTSSQIVPPPFILLSRTVQRKV